MHLKDFSLVSPAIPSGEILKAIEAAIPAEAIEKAIARCGAIEYRRRSLPAPERGLFSDCNQPLVNRRDARCTQKLD